MSQRSITKSLHSKIAPSTTHPKTGERRTVPWRLIALLGVGIVLISAAWGFRSHSRTREVFLRNKDLPELEKIVRSQPDDALAQYYLAKSYYLHDRYPEARAAYEQALRLQPNEARAHLGLGLTLCKLGEIDRAEGELQQSVRLDNRSAWAE